MTPSDFPLALLTWPSLLLCWSSVVLFLRSMAVEARRVARSSRPYWDWASPGSSLIPWLRSCYTSRLCRLCQTTGLLPSLCLAPGRPDPARSSQSGSGRHQPPEMGEMGDPMVGRGARGTQERDPRRGWRSILFGKLGRTNVT